MEDKENSTPTAIDKLLDEHNSDNITVFNENGEHVEFEQIALIPIEEAIYAILKPAFFIEGIAENEAFVFLIEEYEGEPTLATVEDEDIIGRVFKEYYDMLRENNII